MEYIECFSVSPEKVRENVLKVKKNVNLLSVRRYAKQRMISGEIDGYYITEDGKVIEKHFGARLSY